MNTEQQIYLMYILTIVEHSLLAFGLLCALIYKWYKKKSWTDRQRDDLQEQMEEMRDIVCTIQPKAREKFKRRF